MDTSQKSVAALPANPILQRRGLPDMPPLFNPGDLSKIKQPLALGNFSDPEALTRLMKEFSGKK